MDETLSRSRVQRLIADGHVMVDGKTPKASQRLSEGATGAVERPEPEATDILPEQSPLDILYEDEDVIVVNKARGMVVHPAAGVSRGTLVNALLAHCKDLSGINGELRPGIVHRIDRDTTGILIVCKNDAAHTETETVETTYEVTKPATDKEAGIGTYTAEFKNEAFETKNTAAGRKAMEYHMEQSKLRRIANYF